ncbi:hypothetical protein [Limisphaera sp. 4302-co]|uniref:hypothetical protein n=1 Tax=Limisphaera sp. 4302-co TaxID=3400417 RepID=UPI003C2982FB
MQSADITVLGGILLNDVREGRWRWVHLCRQLDHEDHGRRANLRLEAILQALTMGRSKFWQSGAA